MPTPSVATEKLIKLWREHQATGGDPDFDLFVDDYFLNDYELTGFLDNLGNQELSHVFGDDLKARIIGAVMELLRDPDMMGSLVVNASAKPNPKLVKYAGTVYEEVPQFIRVAGNLYRLAEPKSQTMADVIKNSVNLERLFDDKGDFVGEEGPYLERDERGPGQIFTDYYGFLELDNPNDDSSKSDEAAAREWAEAEKVVEALNERALEIQRAAKKKLPENERSDYNYLFALGDYPDGLYLVLKKYAYDV